MSRRWCVLEIEPPYGKEEEEQLLVTTGACINEVWGPFPNEGEARGFTLLREEQTQHRRFIITFMTDPSSLPK